MTQEKLPDRFDDELLSAYVDGELTGEQLAQVEQQLANDPRARQSVEELRTLSREIQTLPKEALGQDLRTTVLQRAERTMLLGSEPSVISKPRVASTSRRWAWAAMALAASLMLSIYLPTSPQEDKPLASAKPVPKSVPRLEAAKAEVSEDVEEAPEEEALELKPVIAGETRASSSIPSADRALRSGGGAGGLAAVPEKKSKASEEKAFEELDDATSQPTVEPTCLVHLTLNNATDGVEQFNRLLVSQGIALRQNEDPESEEQPESGEQEAPSDEMFLVEAPIEQIENVLEASNLDTSNYAEVRLEQPSAETPPDRWQQWERSGKSLSQDKLKRLQQKAKSALQTQQGWATRIKASQYLSSQQSGATSQRAKQRGRKKAVAKDPVQVLFILRAAPVDR